MTARAQKFIGPMTFQALTRRPVFTDLFSLTEEATIGHIQLADRADLVIVAPATANVIARLARGHGDDAVTAIVLATRAPVLLAPSMNVNMWNHPLTQANVRRLVDVARLPRRRPGRWLPRVPVDRPGSARRARRHRRGRRARCCRRRTSRASSVVVTRGPDVRGHRSGPLRRQSQLRQDGHRARRRRAAPRCRASRSCSARAPCRRRSASRRRNVETAAQLQWALGDAVKGADVVIMTAAVADYRPAKEAKEKLKRGELGAKTHDRARREPRPARRARQAAQGHARRCSSASPPRPRT